MEKIVCNRAKHPGHPLENIEARYRTVTRYGKEQLCEKCATPMLIARQMLINDFNDGALLSIVDLSNNLDILKELVKNNAKNGLLHQSTDEDI
ncbi:MAG: hypothetical protein HYW77_01525 [Parcubacteria group bacterium]|nr:hypothetical protein [Parcubacteria group bacterium]